VHPETFEGEPNRVGIGFPRLILHGDQGLEDVIQAVSLEEAPGVGEGPAGNDRERSHRGESLEIRRLHKGVLVAPQPWSLVGALVPPLETGADLGERCLDAVPVEYSVGEYPVVVGITFGLGLDDVGGGDLDSEVGRGAAHHLAVRSRDVGENAVEVEENCLRRQDGPERVLQPGGFRAP